MKVWSFENVVYVRHSERCEGAAAKIIIDETRVRMDEVLRRYPRQAVFHDGSLVKSAENAYLLAWSEIGKQYQAKSAYVVVVPNVWVRSIVKSIMFLGRFDIQTVKSWDEGAAVLAREGFTVRNDLAPA